VTYDSVATLPPAFSERRLRFVVWDRHRGFVRGAHKVKLQSQIGCWDTPGGPRTRNLPCRMEAPYPLGHKSCGRQYLWKNFDEGEGTSCQQLHPPEHSKITLVATRWPCHMHSKGTFHHQCHVHTSQIFQMRSRYRQA
jgi:hypothetical protein